MLYLINLEQATISAGFQLARLVSGWMKLCHYMLIWTLTFLEVTARRHWEKSRRVSLSGTRKTSCFQTWRQGHRLLRVAVPHLKIHPPQDPSSPHQDPSLDAPSVASPSPATSRSSIAPTAKSFSLKRKLYFPSTSRSAHKLTREERELLKPLPKRPYDLTPEELDESVLADVTRHLAPKRPPPKEIIPAEKVERCLKNLSRPPPQPPKL